MEIEEKLWTDTDMAKAHVAGQLHGISGKVEWKYWEKWLSEYKKSKQKYTDEEIEWKIASAFRILTELKVPENVISKVTCLCMLAMCSQTPQSRWQDITTRISIKNSEMIKWAVENYNLKEHSNNRDQFRREGINILLNYDIIDLNPDNRNLGPNSPLTHYAVKQRIINRINRRI